MWGIGRGKQNCTIFWATFSETQNPPNVKINDVEKSRWMDFEILIKCYFVETSDSPRQRVFAIDKENRKCHTCKDPEPSLNSEGGDQSDILRHGIRDPVQDALLVSHPSPRKPNALRNSLKVSLLDFCRQKKVVLGDQKMKNKWWKICKYYLNNHFDYSNNICKGLNDFLYKLQLKQVHMCFLLQITGFKNMALPGPGF